MTNINCSKSCKYQTEGKCGCDSVILPFLNGQKLGNSDCPYQTAVENKAKNKELQ